MFVDFLVAKFTLIVLRGDNGYLNAERSVVLTFSVIPK